MKHEQKTEQDLILQLVSATESRNAGQNYFEISGGTQIKFMLATYSSEKLDKLSRENELFFRYRFGFEATEVVREKVIVFKKQYGLMDREIKRLNRTGFLVVTRTEIKLNAHKSVPVAGWTQLVLFALMCIGMCFQIAFSTAPAWGQGLGELLLVGIACAGISYIYQTYIAPWKVLSQSGAIRFDGNSERAATEAQ